MPERVRERADCPVFPGQKFQSETLPKFRACIAGLAALMMIQGCKIVQTASPGGAIVSRTGQHDCSEGQTCTVEIPNGAPFRDIFTAVPRTGYAFAGWRQAPGFLCGGTVAPCALDIPRSLTRRDVTGYLTAEFYHQPVLVSPGTLGIEYSVWEGDVPYEYYLDHFGGDLDGDGDDDVILVGATYPNEPFTGAREGVILLNNGDFTFTIAAGDRPWGVHPREVLLADFNGDGMPDIFIADHGYDTAPFPGWDNQLLLWTAQGYRDASDQFPADPTGFTHNAAVGDVDSDGDIDILVANNGGQFIEGPYFLLNDGAANFTVNTSNLPDVLEPDSELRQWPWAVDIADLDDDGYEDLVIGMNEEVRGESFVYWGAEDGEYRDDRVSMLATPEFFVGFGGASTSVISTAIHDVNDDGLLDILLGGYNSDPTPKRGVQILINDGHRRFNDETQRRLGNTAWSPSESWHQEYRFFDFNHDGTVDIVPMFYDSAGDNILAWLNDGTGHYVALKTTQFRNTEALKRFAWGVKVRVGSAFKSLEFYSDGTALILNSAVTVTDAVITLPD